MKQRILGMVLALAMVGALAACGINGNADASGKDTTNNTEITTESDDTQTDKDDTTKDNTQTTDDTKEVTMTAEEVMSALKDSLGESFDCDVTETEDRMSGYYELDLSKVESWAAMSNSNSSLNPSTAVVLKVTDGYADEAAALLQSGYEQILSYSRMYDMSLLRVQQARLFVNGDYVALLILGVDGDWQDTEENQAKFALDEAAKVDAAWSAIFGDATNTIVIPEDDGDSSNGFFEIDEE